MPKVVLPDPTTVPDPPDIIGFKDAMDRLRLATGTVVGFEIPVAAVYDPAVPLGDDGSPLDPTVVPTSGGGFTEVLKRVGIIVKDESSLRPGSDTHVNEIGFRSGIDSIFDLAVDDYPDVSDAMEVWWAGLKFRIVEWKPFALGRLLRYAVYCEEK